MASYTPIAIVTQVALGTGAGTSVFTGTAAHTYVVRTWDLSTPSSGKTATASLKADAAGTRVFETLALTQAVPTILNGWWVVAGAGAHDIDANCAATAVSLGAYGLDWN